MAERRDKTEAAAPRKRALVSCDRCKLRRARCIRNNPDEPCADCKMSGVQCESKLPRKQRVYGSVETLSLRYRALESLLKGLFPQENIQDTNTIFQMAATRNIPMPANDDFTPADIFSNKDSQPSLSTSTQQSQGQSQHQTSQIQLPHLPSPQTTSGSVRSADTESLVSASKHTVHNPFSDVRRPSQQPEELIPTRHGVSHYFGPSSSFRLATTIRALVARYKAAPGDNFPVSRSSASSASEAAERASAISQPHTSANPSDEEYTVPVPKDTLSPTQGRRGSKRSRSKMEETYDPWERGNPNTETIADLLPSRTLADALVLAYFDHVHIYFPLFHRSMFQYRLEATYARSADRLSSSHDIGWLVCLSLVFSFGCRQLQEHDPDQANTLRLKYLAFAKANVRQILATTSLVNVQALVLFSFWHDTLGQKTSSWLFVGLAARMAMTMGMHRDGTNLEFDPIERNTRRQVWWSIYVFERILCGILGRPTAIDDHEMSMRIADAPMLEQKSTFIIGMPAEFMTFAFSIVKLSYSIRQRAYFDKDTAEERTPTLAVAERLLTECDNFFATIPPDLGVNYSPVPSDQRARILLLHIYYYYTRCIVTRDFLIQKVERGICYLENQPPPYMDDWGRTLLLSDDCVESAHRSLQCIVAGADLGMIGNSWLDLFFVFHSVLIVCADFLARPREQRDSPKDMERKEMVRTMLNIVRSMRKLPPTYTILSQVAIQFASITRVAEEPVTPQALLGQPDPTTLEPQPTPEVKGFGQTLAESSNIQDDWFASATTQLGLDFFDLNQASGATPVQGSANQPTYQGYYTDPNAAEVDEWTARTLKGIHSL